MLREFLVIDMKKIILIVVIKKICYSKISG